MKGKTKMKHEKTSKRYGSNEIPANPLNCVKEVWSNFVSYQCQRKRGFGPGKRFCKQHNPIAIKAKDKIKEDIRNKKLDKIVQKDKRFKILLKMAKGIPTNKLHNYKIKGKTYYEIE